MARGWIDLEIDLLNLLPARYNLSLSLTGESMVVYDRLQHCVKLEVEPSSIYESNRVLDSRYGIVYFPQRWNLNGLSLDSTRRVVGESSLKSQ